MSTAVGPQGLIRVKEYLGHFNPQTPQLDKYMNFITQTQPPQYSDRGDLFAPNSHQHHIVPQRMDKNHEFENHLACLGVADHFIAHYLLFRALPAHPPAVEILSYMAAKALPLCVMLPKGHSPDAKFWSSCDVTLVQTIARKYAECWRFERITLEARASGDKPGTGENR